MAGNVLSKKNKGKRLALGRGLGALMVTTKEHFEREEVEEAPPKTDSLRIGKKQEQEKLSLVRVAAKEPVAENEQIPSFADSGIKEFVGLEELTLDELEPNKHQPRKHFDESEIESLSRSIKESGLLQPILVRKKVGSSKYEIIAGERRYRAARKAQLASVPVIVKSFSDKEALEIGIIENVQREDLNPIEEALAFRRLSEEFEASQQQIAEKVGKDRASIANSMRLLKLEPGIQELIARGSISAGHGRALLMLDTFEKRRALIDRILAEDLSVRACERIASGAEVVKNAEDEPSRAKVDRLEKVSVKKSPQTVEIEDKLREVLGTKVSLLIGESGAGELKINFYSQVELESVLEKFGI